MVKSSSYLCLRCNNAFASSQSLWNHKQRCQRPTVKQNLLMSPKISTFEISTSKICKKKADEKRPPHYDEIIHFDSNEFEDGGNPKSQHTLNKLNQLINKEVSIGMGITTPAAAVAAAAAPSPAIGYVAASVPGVPGKPPSLDEIQKILKPIAPPITINAPARCKKVDNKAPSHSKHTSSDEDDDEDDMETEEDDDEDDDMETDNEDDDDDNRLRVDDVMEHLVPVNGNQGGVSDMNHMIKVTAEDLTSVKCKRVKNLLNKLKTDLGENADYEDAVNDLIVLVNQYCSGKPQPCGEKVLRDRLRSLERSPAKRSLLQEILVLTNDISDEWYRVREIFTRLSNIEKKRLTTLLTQLEREKLIDSRLNEKLTALPSITYPELRKLLVLKTPELLAQQIDYTDDGIITGTGEEEEDLDIWKTLRKTIGQHRDKEEGRLPEEFIHSVIDELQRRKMINDEQYDILNKDIYNKLFEQIYHDMDHVHGSGIWSTIARKIMETATKGVAGVTGQQVANKAGHAVLDGASSALRKRTETLIDEALKKKKKIHNYLDDIPLGGI